MANSSCCHWYEDFINNLTCDFCWLLNDIFMTLWFMQVMWCYCTFIKLLHSPCRSVVDLLVWQGSCNSISAGLFVLELFLIVGYVCSHDNDVSTWLQLVLLPVNRFLSGRVRWINYGPSSFLFQSLITCIIIYSFPAISEFEAWELTWPTSACDFLRPASMCHWHFSLV